MLRLPYGTGFLDFEEGNATVLESGIEQMRPGKNGEELVREAMENGPSLQKMAKGKKRCTILLSDHTRPVPSRVILPEMLKRLREGNPDIDITLLVGTGLHRKTREEELLNKLGGDILKREKIRIHDANDMDALAYAGILPSGGKLYVNRLAIETDLLLSEGFVEPHFFAGFSGGRKSVLPGISAKSSILYNHSGRMIADPHSRTGILEGNPIHLDMTAAAEMVKLAYCVNVVVNSEKKVAAAFAGVPERVHADACAFLRKYCNVSCKKSDIVLTTNGGAPLDQNLYQCVKGLTAAEAAAKDGGVIILCASCSDGTGGDSFYRQMKETESAEAFFRKASGTPPEDTEADQWQSQILARVLMNHPVIIVTGKEMEKTVADMKMLYAESLITAMETAKSIMGQDASLTVIPDGVSVIVRSEDR